MCVCLYILGVLLQDTFTEAENAFCLKAIFKDHGVQIKANNNPKGNCTKEAFESRMEIHFVKTWLDDYKSDNQVNFPGNILGLAYGGHYWSPDKIEKFLPNEDLKRKCRTYYSL